MAVHIEEEDVLAALKTKKPTISAVEAAATAAPGPEAAAAAAEARRQQVEAGVRTTGFQGPLEFLPLHDVFQPDSSPEERRELLVQLLQVGVWRDVKEAGDERLLLQVTDSSWAAVGDSAGTARAWSSL